MPYGTPGSRAKPHRERRDCRQPSGQKVVNRVASGVTAGRSLPVTVGVSRVHHRSPVSPVLPVLRAQGLQPMMIPGPSAAQPYALDPGVSLEARRPEPGLLRVSLTPAVSARIITDAEETPVVIPTAKPEPAAVADPRSLPVLASPQPMRENLVVRVFVAVPMLARR